MPVTLNPQGKADWTDYQDYWRDDDAEWLQERSIVRYATSAARATEWPNPSPGHVTYNQATDQLEHFSATAPAKWIGVLASQHLLVTPKTSAADSDPVVLGHRGAAGGGLQFHPTVASENKIALPNAYLDIGAGAIVAKVTGLTVTAPTALAATTFKTGAKTVALSTDTDSLVFDSKITAPSATLAAITMSGTLSGGASSIVNANSGTIGGVTLGSAYISAPSGYVSAAGYFSGDASAGYLRQRNTSTGAVGTANVRVDVSNVSIAGGVLDISATPRMFGVGTQFYNSAGSVFLGYGGPVIYSASDPGAASYPNGTIWFS